MSLTRGLAREGPTAARLPAWPRRRGLWLWGWFLAAGVTWSLMGCGSKTDRCRKCGMDVNQHPRWIAGLTNAAGQEERFCCERCMFAYTRSPQGTNSHGAWVTEYYSQKRMPVDDVFFVVGSDVTGPMGQALVPVAGRAAAEQFLKDHHGQRIVSAKDITPELLREIAGKAPAQAPKPGEGPPR